MTLLQQIKDTYDIVEELGQGSGGTVFRAYHKRLRKEVVLKRLHNNNHSELYRRKEVDILKKLNHSYLPQVLDFLQLENEVYTVMSYIPGKSFQQLLGEGRIFTRKEIVHWAVQLCSALEYLHGQNPPIIHSDIKPANIMLMPSGDICLIDFNISFFMEEKAVLGYTGGYTSPEQYIVAMSTRSQGAAPIDTTVDEKSDIYSLGATLYRLATGKKIENFKQGVDIDLLESAVGETLARIIQRATEVEPEQRFASARQMRIALEEISLTDKRYKKLIFKQKIARVLWSVLLLGSGALIALGISTMGKEKTAKYNGVVQDQKAAIKAAEYAQQEVSYEAAKAIKYEEIEAHYQNAYALYKQKEFKECIEFIDDIILNNEQVDKPDERMDEVYYLKADSLFQLEDYDAAVSNYADAVKLNSDNAAYRRDYAIALAYDGNDVRAREVLAEAIDKGLEDDSVHYVKGEIEYLLANSTAAINEFDECLAASDDDYMKMRAYVMKSKILDDTGQQQEAREVLLEARQQLPIDQQMNILERLVAVDLKLMDKGYGTYLDEAVTVSEEIIEQKWSTYTTYNNLAILYQRQTKYVRTEQILEEMKTQFGEDYNIYKRYAYLELERQESLKNSDRDYADFEFYYDKASQMYLEQLENNQTDTEMQLLDELYLQVVKGGWLS